MKKILAIAAILSALGFSAFAQTTPHSKATHLTEGATQNYVTANEGLNRLDETINDHESFAMADANVTLTATQQFETNFFEMTGANTAVRDLILRSECGGGSSPCEKRLTVFNNTTGGFDVRVKYATGASVNVSPGMTINLQGDGTDIIVAGSIDIPQLTVDGTCDSANDEFVFYDADADEYKSILCGNLPGGSGGGGGAFAGFTGALVHTDDAQTITTATWTALDWDVQDFDTSEIWEGVTNPTRFTIPNGWLKVRVCWNVGWDPNATGLRSVRIHKNGVATNAIIGGGQDIFEPESGTSGGAHQACTGPIAVGSGDYLEVAVFQNSGGNLDVQAGTVNNRVWASIELLDPLPVSRVSDNQLVNGDFQVCQRLAGGCTFTAATTPANSDDVFGLDRWIHLTEANDSSDYGRETTVVPGAPGATTALKSETETANNKFGWIQILPADRSNRLIGSTASLSFKARSTTGLQVSNVRAAVLCWDGTADTVTSDVVSAWNTPGTNPTFATNWTAENTPADLAVTLDSYATIKVEGISIDTAACKNVGAFIWVDEDTAVNDLLYITDVQLEPSSLASGYQRQDFEDVITECERHYFKTYDVGVSPGATSGVGAIHGATPLSNTNISNLETNFARPMFKIPTITWYSPSTGSSGNIRNRTSAADVSVSSTLDTGQKNSGIPVTGSAVASGQRLAAHLTAEAEL